MGIPIDLFVDQNIDEEFICSICHDVLEDATLTHPCEHVFCKGCIEQWRTRGSTTCPVDRRRVSEHKTPQRIYMNLLNKLKLRCSFDGCDSTLPLGDLRDHKKTCEFNPENPKQCGGGCGASLTAAQRQSHVCVEYLKNQLTSVREELHSCKHELKLKEQSLKGKALELLSKELKMKELKQQLKTKDINLKIDERRMNIREIDLQIGEEQLNSKQLELRGKESQLKLKEELLNVKAEQLNAKEEKLNTKEEQLKSAKVEDGGRGKDRKIKRRNSDLGSQSDTTDQPQTTEQIEASEPIASTSTSGQICAVSFKPAQITRSQLQTIYQSEGIKNPTLPKNIGDTIFAQLASLLEFPKSFMDCLHLQNQLLDAILGARLDMSRKCSVSVKLLHLAFHKCPEMPQLGFACVCFQIFNLAIDVHFHVSY